MPPDNDRPIPVRITKNIGSGKTYYTIANIPGDQTPVVPNPHKPKRVEPNRFNHLEVDGFSRRNKL